MDLGILRQGFEAWMYNPQVPIGQWSQVRVTKAIPVITLLSEDIQTQISDLYSSMITYSPLVFKEEPPSGCTSGDTPCAAKLIKSVTIWANDHINSLCVTYSDGSVEVEVSKVSGPGETFSLDIGE